jgi:hypothetical protein
MTPKQNCRTFIGWAAAAVQEKQPSHNLSLKTMVMNFTQPIQLWVIMLYAVQPQIVAS